MFLAGIGALGARDALAERERCTILVVIHSREPVSGIHVLRTVEEELLERLHRPGAERITDAGEGDPREERLGTRNGDGREVIWEDLRPVGHEVIPRERDVRVTAGDHLGEVTMHDPEATGETRYLRGEEGIGRGLREQRPGGCPALGTNIPRIR